jgi:outer membrane protein assembly factor BamB
VPRACLPCLLVFLAGGADWPQWRGPKRDGVWPIDQAVDPLPAKVEPRWKNKIGGGFGGIAVAAGRVYLMDRLKGPPEVERVLCLDATTGKQLWAHTYGVTYGKLDYGNGPRATPTIHAGRVYALGALGHLHCLDAKSGKVMWQRDTVKEFRGTVPTWGHACSPLVDGKLLVVQVGGQPDACLVALDTGTGKEVWRGLSDRPGYSSPVLVDGGNWRLLAYFTPQHVVGLDPQTGKVRWRVPFDGITYDVAISDVVYLDGVLLASNYWSGSKAIRLDEQGLNPKVAWEGKDLSLLMSTPLAKGGHVFALDRFRGVKCIEVKTGKVVWEGWHVTPRDRNPQASLVWAGSGDRALILTTPGELVVADVSVKGYKVLSRTLIVGRTWAHPAFANGCAFARNDEEIVCVSLRPAGPAAAPPR